MRIRTGLVLVVLLAAGAAGCSKANDGTGVATAGGQRSATSSAKPDGLSENERALKFAQCMRDNGVPNFPDPKFGDGGGISITVPDGSDPQKVDAAQQKCKQYMPNGGEPQKLDPQQLEQMRKMAQCMRDNGVPNFPDPDPNGGMKVEQHSAGSGGTGPFGTGGMDPNDPKFQAAQKACDKYGPPGRSGVQNNIGGNK